MDPITESDIETAWSAEIARRLAEIDAGTVELIPWDDVRSELFGESVQVQASLKRFSFDHDV